MIDRNGVQYWVSDEEYQNANCDHSKTAHVREASFGEYVALSFLFLMRIWIVQPIVFFDIFWEQQQASRWQDVIFFRHRLRVDIIVVAARS